MPRHLPLFATVLITAFLTAAPVFAQNAITPGHADLDLSLIGEGENHYAITVKQGPMEQPFGTVTTELSIDEESGTVTEIRSTEMMGQKFADTTRAVWPTMASVSHVSNSPQRTLRFSVADGMISGSRSAPGGEPTAFEMSVDGPVFDSSWMSTLAPMLPLAEGYAATISAFEDDEAGLGDYALVTSGPISLELSNGQKYDVWEVAATSPGGETVRYFYDTTDRALLRIAFAPQPGLEVFIDAEMGEGK